MKNNIVAEVQIPIKAPVARIWGALTRPEIIKQYFFGTETHTDWQVGHPIRFTGEWEGKTYEDKGTILDYQENKLLKYSYWSSMSGIEDKPENYVIVTYEISGTDYEVTLSITQENIPTEEMKQHSIENWKKVMNGMKELVEASVKEPNNRVTS